MCPLGSNTVLEWRTRLAVVCRYGEHYLHAVKAWLDHQLDSVGVDFVLVYDLFARVVGKDGVQPFAQALAGYRDAVVVVEWAGERELVLEKTWSWAQVSHAPALALERWQTALRLSMNDTRR